MSRIEVKIDDSRLNRALKRLEAETQDVPAILKNVGEALHNATLERMDKEQSPDGQAWTPLSDSYKSGKKGKRMLEESGTASGLKGSLNYQVRGNGLEYGTNKAYGRIHQEGGTIKPVKGDRLYFKIGSRLVAAKKVEIPARPYLGIGPMELDAIDGVLNDLLAQIDD